MRNKIPTCSQVPPNKISKVRRIDILQKRNLACPTYSGSQNRHKTPVPPGLIHLGRHGIICSIATAGYLVLASQAVPKVLLCCRIKKKKIDENVHHHIQRTD